MRSFEERLATLGRSIDRMFEALRERRPRRYQRRVGPTLREQAHERVTRTKEFFREGEWKQTLRDERTKKRIALLGGALVLTLLAAVPWWIVRGINTRPSMQELMDQAMVRARLEMAAQNSQQDATMGSWGAGPGSGAQAEQGMNRWGP
jgi:hypothetical protein